MSVLNGRTKCTTSTGTYPADFQSQVCGSHPPYCLLENLIHLINHVNLQSAIKMRVKWLSNCPFPKVSLIYLTISLSIQRWFNENVLGIHSLICS